MVNTQLHGALRTLRDAQALAESPDAQLLMRFALDHEPAPLGVLVRRHGPMVWSVSRRMLSHMQDAEDVFQATFLLLAKKAASIRKGESVGSWLHGVAHRLALKLRQQQSRRLSREKRAADMRQTNPSGDISFSEVQAALDAALGQLPEIYRAALVLCYLEGNTQEEAARRLGCPLATVRTRVARGRKLLRDRLAKQGLALSTAGLGALLIASAAPAAAPAALTRATVGAARVFAAGQPAAALCSPQAAGLIEEGLRAMFLTKLKTATSWLLLTVCLIAGAAVLTQRPAAADETAKPQATSAKPSAPADEDSLAYAGRVLGPDGRPVAGARLYLTYAWGYLKRPSPSPEYATTGADGRFAFTVPKATFGDRHTVLAATAANHGPAWVTVPPGRKRDDLTLRLVADDEPITGQVVDLEGKPVPGATLTVLQINAARGEDLGPWLEAVKARKGLSYQIEQQYIERFTVALSPKATTDARGRFRLAGIGRNRLVRAQLDGPTIASQQICILTRPGKSIEVTESEGKPAAGDPRRVQTYYAASFRHVAAPTKPIVGVVRDADTKKPLAGATIRSYKFANNPIHGMGIVEATTDAQGRYRLSGMPKGDDNKILLIPPADLPYVRSQVVVPDSPGLGPVTVDFALKRGVWIEGKLTDKVTGQPLKGHVEYFSLYSNPNLRDYSGFDGTHETIIAGKADGTYRIVGLPGPGVVAVYYQNDPYLRANQRDDEFALKDPRRGEAALLTSPYILFFPQNFGAVARVEPARGADRVKRDITLDPGWTFKGTVLGPDGKPLAGARRFDLNGKRWWDREPLKSAEFTSGFNPRHPHELLFQHRESGLVGVARPPKENGGSVTVRLEPGAAVTGRLVNADGKPQAGVELELALRPRGWGGWHDYSPERIKTDGQGRFRVEGLIPDYEFRLRGDRGELPLGGLRSGQTKDLGDVQLKQGEPAT